MKIVARLLTQEEYGIPATWRIPRGPVSGPGC